LEQIKELEKFLLASNNVFSLTDNDLGQTSLVCHEVDTDDHEPILFSQRRMDHPHQRHDEERNHPTFHKCMGCVKYLSHVIPREGKAETDTLRVALLLLLIAGYRAISEEDSCFKGEEMQSYLP